MKKTNRTYQVYVSTPKYTSVLAMGTKSEMTALFEQTKGNPEYDCVILHKWSERYQCWCVIDKDHMHTA